MKRAYLNMRPTRESIIEQKLRKQSYIIIMNFKNIVLKIQPNMKNAILFQKVSIIKTI